MLPTWLRPLRRRLWPVVRPTTTRRARLTAERLEGRDAPAVATFQQGVNGYTGTFERRIGDDFATSGQNGSDFQQYFVDGPGTGSADQLDLIRFDNIFGTGPGQIPLGSVINFATLTYTTSTVSNAPTAGPYGVSRMLVPFDGTTTYSSFTGGPSEANGTFSRMNGAFVSGTALAIPANGTAVATVTGHIQDMALGAPNHGFAVRAETTDGWSINTIGNSTLARRPLLIVDYTPPDEAIGTARFQQGVNGYSGTVDAWLQSNGTTTAGSGLNQQFLDGGTPDDQLLVRFNNVFGGGAGQVPTNSSILQAWLVVTTGDAANAQSTGPYSVHRMRVDWTTSSTYAGFGGNGPDVAQNEIAPASDSVRGFIHNGRNYFDVTDAVNAWRTGAGANFGLNVQANGTSDGWLVNFSGATAATARPELIVYYGPPPPPPPLVNTLDIVNGQAVYRGGSTAPNNAVTLSLTGGNYTIADTGGPITLTAAATAAGWTGGGTGSVSASDANVSGLRIDLNVGTDTFTITGVNDPLTVLGGEDPTDTATLPDALTYAGAVSITGFNTISQAAGTGTLTVGTLTLGANTVGTSGANIRTTAGTLNLIGGTGGVFATETDGANVSFQATGAGAVAIRTLAGTLTVAGSSFGGSGPVTLTSPDAVAVNAAIETIGRVAITANTDGAGAQGFSQGPFGSILIGDGSAQAFSLTVNTAGGGTGNAAFGAIVSTAGGAITVTTNGGNITGTTAGLLSSGGGGDGSSVVLRGTTIGTSGASLRVSTGQIDAASGNGGVFVSEISAEPGRARATATGAGNIVLLADDAGNNGMIINGPVWTQTGNITIQADDNLTLQAPVGGQMNGQNFSGTVLIDASLDQVNEQFFRQDEDASLGWFGTITTTNATANAVRINVSATTTTGGVGGGAILGHITVGNGGTITVNTNALPVAARTGRILMIPGGHLDAGPNGTVVLTARNNSIGEAPFFPTDTPRPIVITAGTVVATTNSIDPTTSTSPLQLPGDIYITTTGPASFSATTTSAPGYTPANGFLAGTDADIVLTTQSGALTINGATRTDSGTILLNGAGGIVLNGPVGGAGESGTVILNAGGGTVTQPGGSIVTTGGLMVVNASNATLGQAANNLATVAANITGALSLADADVVNTGAVAPPAAFGPPVAGVTGITAAGTTVTAGRLNVMSGANVTGPVTAGATAVVSGTGTIAGALTANATGSVSPGVSPGRLTVNGNVAFNATSTFVVELNGTTVATQYDQLTVNGTVNLGGATLSGTQGSGFDPALGTSFTIIDNDGTDPVVGTFAELPQGATVMVGGLPLTISYTGGTGNDVVLTRSGAAPLIAIDSITINDGSAQRSVVRSITVRFTGLVTFPNGTGPAFQLTRTGPGGPAGDVTLAVDLTGSTATQTVARLTFSGALSEFGSLIDGRYSLTVFGAQVTGNGQPLDADGNGAPGGNRVVALHRLFGDLTGEATVNGADYNPFRVAFGSGPGNPNYVAAFDFDGDGFVIGSDFNQFRIRFGLSI
jgi:hypothetical protein